MRGIIDKVTVDQKHSPIVDDALSTSILILPWTVTGNEETRMLSTLVHSCITVIADITQSACGVGRNA